jgi:alpha-maltose-1-phosphate synthase
MTSGASPARPVGRRRIAFLNENIGGHATMHLSIARSLEGSDDLEARFLDIPAPLARRVFGAQVPGLARLDLDLQPLRYQLAGAMLARRLLEPLIEEVDAVHVYTQNAALLSAGLLRRVPSVVSIDSTNAYNNLTLAYRYPTRFTARTALLSAWFERRVFEAATLVVAKSQWARSRLVEDFAIPEKKVRVVHFGISIPADPPPHVGHHPPRITFVGSSLERKGGRLLLELHQRHLRSRCILTLVTRDRVDPGLHGVEVRNDIHPGDGQLESVLAETDVFVFPSAIDKSPNAVLEAMAAGLPVVALSVAGVPEMVEHAVTGLLVPESDEAALVVAISSLLDDQAESRRMGERGRRRVLDNYDGRRTTKQLLDIIEEAMTLGAAR